MDEPSEYCCFPYAQHFLSDSPGHYSLIEDKKALLQKLEKVDFDKIDVFSTRSFKLSFIFGGIVSALINTLLLILLFVT